MEDNYFHKGFEGNMPPLQVYPPEEGACCPETVVEINVFHIRGLYLLILQVRFSEPNQESLQNVSTLCFSYRKLE